MTGEVNVTGPPALPPQPLSRSVRAQGVFGASTELGRASDQRQTGDYQLVLTGGTWDVSEVYLSYRRTTTDTTTYLSSSFNYRDVVAQQNPLTISPANPGVRDFDLALGEVIVTFRTAPGSGLLLSDLSLNGNCIAVDDSGETLSSYNLSASDTRTQKDVEVGRVRFFGPAGLCGRK